MFELPGEAAAPDQGTVDGESITATEVEYVEEAFLRFISGERFVFEDGLKVVKDHGSLAHGEDAEPGESLTPVGDAVTTAEEAPIANASELTVDPQAAIFAGGQARGVEDVFGQGGDACRQHRQVAEDLTPVAGPGYSPSEGDYRGVG